MAAMHDPDRGPYVHRGCWNFAGVRRRLRLIVAAVVGAATLTFGLSGAAPVAGVSGQAVTVAVTDLDSPANPRASTWGRIISSPTGIDCPGDCTENFPRGSTVVMTVLPKRGYTFSGWGLNKVRGPGCREARTCSLTIEGDERVIAVLQPAAELLATTEGAGKLVLDPVEAGRPAGTCADRVTRLREYSGACRQRYPNGARVTISAVADKTVPGARFVGWSDYRCPRRGPSCTLTMRGTRYLTAIFEPVFLKVVEGAVDAIDRISPPANCTFVRHPNESARSCTIPYPLNALVTLRRKPQANDQNFWEGACAGVGRTCTVRMHTNRWVQAGPLPGVTPEPGVGEQIRLEYAGPRGGTIAIRPLTGSESPMSCRRTCSAFFGHGDLVEIRAQSGSRAKFRRWVDSNVRSTIRRVRIGTRNPVRAMFVRR